MQKTMKKITREDFDKLTREKQIAYLKKVRKVHLANQKKMQDVMKDKAPAKKSYKRIAPMKILRPEDMKKNASKIHQRLFTRAGRGRFAQLMNQKILVGASVGLIVIGVGIFGANMVRNRVMGQDSDRAIWALLDHEKPVPIDQDGLFGFMNVQGRMIVESRFVSVGEFYGDFVAVKTEGEHLIINRKGETKMELEMGSSVSIDAKHGVWFIEGRMYDIDLKPLYSDEKQDVTYKQRGVYTYRNSLDEVIIMSLRRKENIYVCTNFCSVAVSNSPDFVPDDFVIINENIDGGSSNKIFNVQTGAEVFGATNQLLIPRDRNRVVKNVDGTQEVMYLVGNQVAFSSHDNFDVFDQIGNIVRIANTDDSTKDQFSHVYIDAKTDERVYETPLAGSILTAFNPLFEVKTCDPNGVGISRNGSTVDCEWLSLSTPSINVMEYLRGQRRLLVVGRTADSEEFYDVLSGRRQGQFDQIAVNSSNDDLFVMAKMDDEWFAYSLVTGNQINIPNDVLSNRNSGVPSGVSIFSSYFTVETKSSIFYYNHEMKTFYEISK